MKGLLLRRLAQAEGVKRKRVVEEKKGNWCQDFASIFELSDNPASSWVETNPQARGVQSAHRMVTGDKAESVFRGLSRFPFLTGAESKGWGVSFFLSLTGGRTGT